MSTTGFNPKPISQKAAELDLDLLPPLLRALVKSYALQYQIDAAIPFGIALGCIATAMRGKVRTLISPSWIEHSSLYVVAIADTGDGKSQVMNRLRQPLIDYEVQLQSDAKSLFNLKQNFTSYQISSFLVLRTTYSKKLYTLFSQYKHTGKLIKTKDEIQYLLGVNYSDFSVLMSKEIKPSIKEIIDKTNIDNIKITPIKKGKSVSGYIFHFDWSSPQLEIPILPPSMNSQEINVYDSLITNYQLTNFQSKKILDNVPYLDITKTLYQINLSKSKITTSIGSYTCGVFKKKFGLDL
jgi:hypothetical protein